MATRSLAPEPRRSRSRIVLILVAFALFLGLWQPVSQLFQLGSSGLSPMEQALREAERQAMGLDGGDGEDRPRYTTQSASGFLPPTPVLGPRSAEAVWPPTNDDVTSSPLELAGQLPPGLVFGWVSDLRGIAVPDATVTLRFEEGDAAKAKGPSTTTLPNGTFRIEDVPPGRWTIMAERKGYASAVQTGVEVLAGSDPGAVDLRLAEELVLKGAVASAGKPVEGAHLRAVRTVHLVRDAGAVGTLDVLYSEFTTPASGEFSLGQLPPGSVRLTVEAKGYARLERDLEVTEGMAPLKLNLEAGAVLAGSVRDERGRPVDGAKLELRQPCADQKGAPWAKTTATASGAFEFTELPAAHTFDLYATSERYAPAGPITVTSGSTTNVVVMGTGGSITGRVVSFDTQAPMPGIRVRVVSEDKSLDTALVTETNSEGVYKLQRLPAGTYQVSVANERLTADPRGGLKLATNAELAGIDLTVYPGLEIVGDVVDGESGEWLASATVDLTGRVGPNFTTNRKAKATTDETGAFSFPNLPQGIYTARASLTGYTTGSDAEEEVRVELLRGRLHAPIRLKLYRAGVIEGVVVESGGAAVANAVVQLAHDIDTPGNVQNIHTFKTTTSSGGRFRIEGLPLRSELFLRASAWAPGHSKGLSERITLDRTTPYAFSTILMGEGTPVMVTVMAPQGPLPGATVTLAHRGFQDESPAEWTTRTGPEGVALLPRVPDGSVWISATLDGFIPAGVDANVSSGDGPVEVTLSLEPATSLTGRVTDDSNAPITSGQLIANALLGATGGGAAGINPDGTFKLTGLGKGNFWLDVEAIRHSASGERRVSWAVPKVTAGTAGDIVVLIPMTGRLTGSVAFPSADTNPPAKYQVDLTGSYRDPMGRARNVTASASFDTGRPFLFDNLPTGEYRLTARAANYLPLAAGPFSVTSGGEASAGTVTLRLGGSIKARIVNARTEEPVRSARLSLSNGPEERSNADGSVEINPVAPGLYNITFEHSEFLPRVDHLISVTRGKETDLGVVALEPGAVLGGSVVDGEGKDLAGILVETQSIEVPEERRRVRTDASGEYLLRGMVPGGHLVKFSGTVNRRPVSRSLNVTVTTTHPTEQNVVLAASSTLFGWLAAPVSVDLGRAIVRAYPLSPAGIPEVSQPIDADARSGSTFRIDQLVEGRYLIAVQAPRLSRTHYWSGVVTVSGPQTRATIAAGLNTLQGTILDRKGGTGVSAQPIRIEYLSTPEHGIASLRPWWTLQASTDADGFFEVPLLPAGVFSFVARNPQFDNDVLEVVTLPYEQLVYVVEYNFGRKATPEKPPKTWQRFSEQPIAPSREIFGGGN